MRTVAILGRPNVGKSTLFNRLVGRRRALVHNLPGVTRDRIEGEARFGDLAFRVIDTAGMTPGGAEGSLEARLTAGALLGLELADVGLFMIDARAGLTSLDRDLADGLRRSRKPVLLVANKSEGRAALAGAGEAWALGLGEPIAVSAEHGDGLVDLLDALRPHLADPTAEPQDDLEPTPSAEGEGEDAEAAGPEGGDTGPDYIRLAVVGRPNVGKSSLINRLVASERLLTGPEPGLTRDAVDVAWEWEGRRIELVDTAGLRRKARIEAAVERLSASSSVRAIRGAHVALLVIDATQPLEHQDLTIAGLAIDEGRALVLAANKWDLVEDPQATLRQIADRVEASLAQVKGLPVARVSARTGRGLERLLPTVVGAFERWRKRVPTPKLNRWLREALERHPPPLVGKRRVKIRYMTQATSRPPTFALFANQPAEALPTSYMRYLAAGLREAFDLPGVPLRFHVRHGENPYDRG